MKLNFHINGKWKIGSFQFVSSITRIQGEICYGSFSQSFQHFGVQILHVSLYVKMAQETTTKIFHDFYAESDDEFRFWNKPVGYTKVEVTKNCISELFLSPSRRQLWKRENQRYS